MSKFRNVILIRIGSDNITKIKHPQHHSPPLSLKYVKALLERQGNYKVGLVDCWVNQLSSSVLLETILAWPAELIVISMATFTSEAGIDLVRLIKKAKDIFVIGVGQDVTARHQGYLTSDSEFDVIIRGEFEQELFSLIKQLNATNDIEKIKQYYRVQKSKEVAVVSCLDDLPSLDWDREELKAYPFTYPLRLKKRALCGYISTSRGCPHNCIFCCSAVRESSGKVVRFRSASTVVDELENMWKIGVNVVSFEDDNFTASKEHVFSICAEIQKRCLGIKWIANARIDEITPELLKTMKKAGCILLLFGVESGSKRIINILAKDFRDIDWLAKAKDVFRETKKADIATCALFIVGNPTETEQEVDDSIKLAQVLKPDMIKVHFFTLYPGSTAYDLFRGYINQKQISCQHHYLLPLVNVSGMGIIELRKAQVRFYRSFLTNPFFMVSHVGKYIFFYIFNWPMSWKLAKKSLSFLFFKR